MAGKGGGGGRKPTTHPSSLHISRINKLREQPAHTGNRHCPANLRKRQPSSSTRENEHTDEPTRLSHHRTHAERRSSRATPSEAASARGRRPSPMGHGRPNWAV
jgi:hypothetical protein